MIDTPLNMSLRLLCWGFTSKPIESLRNLATELPLDLRKIYNAFLYTARTIINIENASIKYLAKNIKEAEDYQIDSQRLVKRKSPNFHS